MDMGNEYLQNAMASFETYKGLADRAVAQISDEQFFATLDAGSNSIAVIIKHVTGNLRSRWTNFLTADGEKPNRNRDAEFEMADSASRSELMAAWEYGWACAFRELKALKPDDLTKTIYIRGEPHSVVKAIGRQLTHGAYHVGQIVLLAKHYADGSWETLTVPRGKSEDLNAEMFSRQTGGSR